LPIDDCRLEIPKPASRSGCETEPTARCRTSGMGGPTRHRGRVPGRLPRDANATLRTKVESSAESKVLVKATMPVSSHCGFCRRPEPPEGVKKSLFCAAVLLPRNAVRLRSRLSGKGFPVIFTHLPGRGQGDFRVSACGRAARRPAFVLGRLPGAAKRNPGGKAVMLSRIKGLGYTISSYGFGRGSSLGCGTGPGEGRG